MDVFYQMTSALRYIHDRNVLHRDLKTANIFLTKEGMVKIGDFGISKMLTTRQGGAQTVLGTPYYISPEMCEGKIYDESFFSVRLPSNFFANNFHVCTSVKTIRK